MVQVEVFWIVMPTARRHNSEDLDSNLHRRANLMSRNIRRDFCEISREGVDWMHLTQDRDQWRALLNTVTNLRVPLKVANFLTS
jgi:hypothetical protein